MGKIRKYLYLLFLSVLCVMSSCDKNEEDSRSLTGTVWIHQFASEDNVNDGSAAAYTSVKKLLNTMLLMII